MMYFDKDNELDKDTFYRMLGSDELLQRMKFGRDAIPAYHVERVFVLLLDRIATALEEISSKLTGTK